MKTFTFRDSTTGKLGKKHSFMTTTRIVVVFLFIATVALSETLNSTIQYSAELEKKQAGLSTISENTDAIENAFKKKMEEPTKPGLPQSSSRRLGIAGTDIAALIPAAPQPTFQARISPYGTLTPQGMKGVVDRGVGKDDQEGK